MGNPTTTPIIERRHAFGFLVSEINDGVFSREEIVLASGAGVCTAGLVLGAIAHALTGAATPLGTNTGNPTFGAIAVGDPAIAGVYAMQMADATHFVVEDPLGVEVGHGVFGAAFAGGGLGFTATAGGTPCVAGDSFKLTVAAGSLKYVPYDPTGNDGREFAVAILGSEYRDATSADKRAAGVVNGPCRVNASELIWGPNVTTDQHKATALAALKALGIKSV